MQRLMRFDFMPYQGSTRLQVAPQMLLRAFTINLPRQDSAKATLVGRLTVRENIDGARTPSSPTQQHSNSIILRVLDLLLSSLLRSYRSR
eukprot:4903569-Amphidinium_carterae.1